MQDYINVLLSLKSKGNFIKEILDDGTEYFQIVKTLEAENYIRGRYVSTDTWKCFSDVEITVKGLQLIEQYQKDNEPWYMKALRWENFDKYMKVITFVGWVFTFILGFFSGKYFG